jgi:hypothetical protein
MDSEVVRRFAKKKKETVNPYPILFTGAVSAFREET